MLLIKLSSKAIFYFFLSVIQDLKNIGKGLWCSVLLEEKGDFNTHNALGSIRLSVSGDTKIQKCNL